MSGFDWVWFSIATAGFALGVYNLGRRGPKPPVFEHYTSTACQHSAHGECRRVCKLCPTACRCTCHRALEEDA